MNSEHVITIISINTTFTINNIISRCKMAGTSHQEDFISRGTFKKLCLLKKEQERDVKTWSEIPVDGTIYKIVESKKVQGKFGECHILTITDKLGEHHKIWAPKKLQKEIEVEAEKPKPRSIYFCSLGQNKKQDGSGYLKNEYESCFR